MEVEQLFCDAARARDEFAAFGRAHTERRVRDAFRQGVAELDRKNRRA